MSKKRSESRRLKATIEQRMAAAAQEIFRLLHERSRAELPELRELLAERLSAAIELILTAFEESRAAERGAADPGGERKGQCPHSAPHCSLN